MKKTTIATKVRAIDGWEGIDVTVFQDGIAGLFVGRLLKSVPDDRRYVQNGRWNVYHHTGTVFPGSGFTTRKQAIEIMHKLSDLTDWTQDADAIGRDYALGDKVRRVYAGREA